MNTSSRRVKFKTSVLIKQSIFIVMTVLITALSFHSSASEPFIDMQDPMRDKNLPSWCPPSDHSGLAVICGTVVINDTVDVGIKDPVPFQPVPHIMVAAYEDNPFSSTGRLEGELTNVFSSTYTNQEGRYRLVVRRSGPPNLKVTVVFFCGGTRVREDVYDSWHNTWNSFTQINCTPETEAYFTENSLSITQGDPPMPLVVDTGSYFMGCTNKPFSDPSIGLSKKYEPVVNNIISEKNYDHRFTLNTIKLETETYFFNNIPIFTSPGGLWEPDCLLRNREGNYVCNAPYPRCAEYEVYENQPCSPGTDVDGVLCDADDHMLSRGYQAQKLYARTDCTADPNNPGADMSACKAEQEAELENESLYDIVDGVLCNTGPTAASPTSSFLEMEPEDYVTRPFFKFIPKSPDEYSVPFRRFEYRNNLREVKTDPYAPVQFTNTYIGSTSNTTEGIASSIRFRTFMGELPEEPPLDSCEIFYNSASPFAPVGGHNALISAGPGTRAREPYKSTAEQIYYSGNRDLSEEVCQTSDGRRVRLCEIQVPWGDGALCNPYTQNCKDPDLRSKLNESLNKLNAASSLIYDANEIARRTQNIQNTLSGCGSTKFVLNDLYFREDMIYPPGNTQIGLHSDTQNDSIPDACERESGFMATSTEQECEPLTGSRVALQDGDGARLNSHMTPNCFVHPEDCVNDLETRGFDFYQLPIWGETEEEKEEELKKRYLGETTWKIDSSGAVQVAMCSISNTYRVDITGPVQEAMGIASEEEGGGGYFDNLFGRDLFEGGNKQHRTNWAPGTGTWYMSHQAVVRDTAMMGLNLFPIWLGERRVGTNNAISELAFASLAGRDIWDSMLTFAGGDARLHDLHFHLPDIGIAILGTLAGESDWKSYGQRNSAMDLAPLEKPYYTVTMDYPLTDESFYQSFRLPGLIEEGEDAGTTYKPSLKPEEWGPGHECYNFDISVSAGYFGGTLREPPYGISRTTRLDKCVNFKRVETATCTCKRPILEDIFGNPIINPLTGEYTYGNVKCAIKEDSREVRNLIIEDCSWENRLFCAQHQETSKAYENWPEGYDKNCSSRWIPRGTDGSRTCQGGHHYYRDSRSGEETTGAILPPEDIDMKICNEDHGDDGSDCPEEPSPYKPPHIPDNDCYDKHPDRWDDPEREQYSYGMASRPGKDRPRCWSSVAGPFRAQPNFSAAGTSTPPGDISGTINNCNGYIQITDSALRASQYEPLQRTDPEFGQKQQALDKTSDIGVIMLRTFAYPYWPFWGGELLGTLTTEDSNEAPIAIDGSGRYNVLTQGQKLKAQGGVGDRSTLRALFAYPVVTHSTAAGKKLQPMRYHCNMLGTYYPGNGNPTGKQIEVIKEITTYNPEVTDEVMGWYCPVVSSPDEPIVDLAVRGGSCTINEFGRCSTFVQEMWKKVVEEDATLSIQEKTQLLAELNDFEFPIYFKYVINYAAYQTNVPAAALLTAMYLEGGLNVAYFKQWQDNAWVFNAGVPWWGQMDLGKNSTCNNLVWTAQGPFKILQQPIRQILNDPIISNRYCSTMLRAGRPNRCGVPYASNHVLAAARCNFLDAAITAGFLLNPEAGDGSHNCSGFDLSAALDLYGAGAYTTEGVDLSSAQALYEACGGVSSTPAAPPPPAGGR